MKNTQFKKKKIFYTLSLCLLVVILSAAAVSVFAEDTASSGWTFTEDTVTNPVYVKEYFTELPRAYEAVVNFPAENYSGTSPIISNKPNNDTRNCFGFEITKEGKPKIFYYETSYVTNTLTKTKTDVVFNYSVIGQGDVRLTVVNEIVDSTSVYKLYVNGVILNDATVTNTVVHDFDAEYSQSTARELSIGGDGADRFKGTLYSLAVYNNALTEAEAANTAKANMEEGSTKLMAYYDSAMSGNSDGFIKDQTGKGHDASEAFFERKNALNDYAYSFAFVGDTQFLVYKDITGKTTKYASPIYDWIVQNKDEKKIEYVLGMGDVTDKNEHAEWEYAVDLHNKLGDADIPYAVIPGNHDGGNRFNAYFGDVASFTDNIDGKKADSDFQNYYMNFEVGQHKYMIVALQYGAPDEVLTWANGVVEANPDRRVIVITHNLFDYEGKLNEAGQREQSTTSNTNLNNGIDMWDEFIKRHKNIIIAAAGHVDPEHIKHSTYEGVNQNTVHTFLIDPQGLDNATRHETGMVAMFYFSEDGSDVQVEYISTYKTLESQKADSSADDILFHERNQFSFTTTAVPSYDTAYGNIPEGKDNNIVLFKKDSSSETGYTCVNGYSTFGAAATVAGLTGTADTTDYVILFRADYLHSSAVSISNYTNNVTIDLGGYTVTLNTVRCGFLHLGAVTHADAANPKTITIKNGYFECTASGSGSTSTSVIVLTKSDSSNHYVNCENVNIKSTSPAYPAVSTAGASTSSNTVNAIFTDCVFDFTSAPTACYMFASGAGTNLGKLNATLVDCKTIATKNTFKLIDNGTSNQGFAYYGGYTTDATSKSNDTLKYGAGNTLLLAKGTTAPTAKQDNLEFVYSTTTTYNEVEYDVYEIAVKTDYGNIPARYAYDKIVVFKSDGTCIGGYSTFKDAATAAGLVFPKRTPDCVILFRGDYTNSTAFTIEGYTNSVIIDLGGYNITIYNEDSKTSCSFLYLTNVSHADAANPKTITVKNGNFNFTTTNTGTSLVRLAGTSGTHYVNCENITIKSTATPYVAVSTQSGSTNVVNATFTNCVFDYADNSSKCYMFGSNSTGQINATITSCKIIGSSTIPMNLILPTNSGTTHALAFYTGTPADTLAYGEGNTLLLKEGVDAPTSTDDVEFVYSETLDGYDVYELNVKEVDNIDVETDYGTIPSTDTNAAIVVFKSDKTFVGGYTKFVDAATAAGLTGTADTTDYVILFRADYPHSSAVSISNYTNNVTIDLGGYTVTLNTGGCGFLHLGAVTHADAKNPKTITIKNGYFECTASGSGSTSTSVIVLKNSSSSNHYVNCENINIKSTSPAYPAVSTAGASTSSNTVNAVFTDCVFDFTSAPTNCFMFASGAGTNLGKLNATIRGGKILAGSNSSIVAINSASSGKGLAFYGGYASSNSNDKLYIEKNAKGEYLKLVLNSSALAPAQTNVYTTTDGVECVFVEASDDGTNTTYTLYPKVMLGYKIKTSVTLYSNFVYNIYVPATNAVSAVYIDGEVVVLDESMITMIEEANYYRIQVSLPASKSLNDITVAVSLASGETTVNAKWTSNVVNYAKTVMDGDSSEIEKTLIRDMLSYAASAHTYFKTTEAVADKLSEITSILGENYDANNKVTVTEDAAKQPADNTYFTSVAIYLGEVPSFRFYLASGYEAIDFAFTVGGRDVETISIDTNGDGTADCIEIVMYAYMMLDDISYTVVSKDTETTVTEYYNLYAYYKYVSSLSGDAADVNLVSIVERLMKYSASADAYRESVVNSTSES